MNIQDYFNEIDQREDVQRAEKKLKARLDLSDAVIRARLKKGWSQAELANQVGTKQANISRIESALANPTINLIQKLCEVLEIEISFQPVQSEQTVVSPDTRTKASNTEYVIASWGTNNCGAQWDVRTSSSSSDERFD